MKSHLRLFSGGLCLLLTLTACGGGAPQAGPGSAPTPSLTPTPSVSISPAPTLSAALDPLSDEALDAYYAARSCAVLSKEAFGKDLLVHYGPAGADSDVGGSFAWYYGGTGERVELPVPDGSGTLAGHEILGQGKLRLTTSGCAADGGRYLFPVSYTLSADPETGSCQTLRDPWQPLEHKAALGTPHDPAVQSQLFAESMYSVIYDARLGLNDLSVAFMPPASESGITNFISGGGAGIPSTAITFDEASRVMTIRLANTALETGELAGGDDWVHDFMVEYDLQFPHSFPAGSLGPGSRFVNAAALSVSGSDAVISLHLTENAYRYTVETGYLENDMYPYFRVVFRDKSAGLDE